MEYTDHLIYLTALVGEAINIVGAYMLAEEDPLRAPAMEDASISSSRWSSGRC